MSYAPGRLDVRTDIQRSLMATYGKRGFNEPNFKHFFDNAVTVLSSMNLTKDKVDFLHSQFEKINNKNLPLDCRREDLLLIASSI